MDETKIEDSDDDVIDDDNELSMTIGVGGVGTRIPDDGIRKKPFHYSPCNPTTAAASNSRGYLPKAGIPGVMPTFTNKFTKKFPKRSITVIEETSS